MVVELKRWQPMELARVRLFQSFWGRKNHVVQDWLVRLHRLRLLIAGCSTFDSRRKICLVSQQKRQHHLVVELRSHRGRINMDKSWLERQEHFLRFTRQTILCRQTDRRCLVVWWRTYVLDLGLKVMDAYNCAPFLFEFLDLNEIWFSALLSQTNTSQTDPHDTVGRENEISLTRFT